MSTETDVVEETKTKLKKPKRWAIVLHNDDVTPMEFVVELLFYVFNMDLNQATSLMMEVHEQGQGVAGIFSYEIAEQKLAEANTLIRLSNMQLKVTMEEE